MEMTVLLHLIAIGTAADLIGGKIPNGLIAAGLLCGAAGQAILSRGAGLACWLAGAALPVLLFGGLYWLRMIGAGDVKLLCVIGGFLGPVPCFFCMLRAILFGGIISAFLVVKRHNLFVRLFYFRTYITQLLKTGQWSPYRRENDGDGQFCFSVPILLGLLTMLGGGR
ncbi:MAG TPA: prepilin peptidase [Candidatus Merdiplasma excrementigallinarum]|uniref:Prepilin peptidase n=1 Tax=Candidatus Merdiplasma excrementigallinarum TaxID=2840864 RepID=A0A9D1NZB9_9FIRM|nr:prepilin peptidase [Candidatus Merdiplasma excrementigallinarum]